MRPGLLDRRIVIQEKATVIAGGGQRTNTWSTHLNTWAMFVQKDGKEMTSDDNRGTARVTNFRVRWHPTVTNGMRIIFKSEFYMIDDIKELGREDGMMIMTTLLTQT